MQCSLSPPKSSSNWLHRLHASKGFSISADLDLDRFLTSSSDPDPNPNPNPNPNPEPPSPRIATLPDPPTKRRRRRRPAPVANPPLFDLMTSALAELFVMGGPSPSQAIGTLGERRKKKKKKSSRKQANPKACPQSASASAAADGGAGAGGGAAACGSGPSSADNSVAEEATKGSKKKRAAAEGPSKDSDLAGYRRTDVTVIDTSSPGWKSVKLIYRKGKEWKVRVKKHWNACQKKKRKVGLVGKKGKEQSKLGSKVLDLKEFSASLDQLRDQENVRAKDEDTLKASDDRTRIPVKRPKFSRSPRLSAVKKSSLLRMQVVPEGKNSAPSSNKGPHKG